MLRAILLLALLTQISACVIVPPLHLAEKYDFQATPPGHKLLSYDDLLCCADCTA